MAAIGSDVQAVADVRHCHGRGFVNRRAIAKLTLLVESPALSRAVHCRRACVVFAASNVDGGGNTQCLDGHPTTRRGSCVRGAIAELAMRVGPQHLSYRRLA